MNIKHRFLGCDSGAGAVLVLTGLGLVLTCFLGALSLVGALASHQRAQTAADFAALAAASRSWQGSSPACDQARIVAELNGGLLEGCLLTVEESDVRVRVRAPFGFTVVAQARAGVTLG